MRSESIDPDVLRRFLARYRAAKGHTLMSLSAKAKASITNSNVRPCSASGASSELQDELIGLGCPPDAVRRYEIHLAFSAAGVPRGVN